jgi:hypothetical protein
MRVNSRRAGDGIGLAVCRSRSGRPVWVGRGGGLRRAFVWKASHPVLVAWCSTRVLQAVLTERDVRRLLRGVTEAQVATQRICKRNRSEKECRNNCEQDEVSTYHSHVYEEHGKDCHDAEYKRDDDRFLPAFLRRAHRVPPCLVATMVRLHESPGSSRAAEA